jgi:hypothetical protein
MKKLMLIVLAAFFVSEVSAQNYLGIKAGGGIAMRMGNTARTNSPGMNVLGGLSYKHQIFKRVLLEGDVLYDIKNAAITFEDGAVATYGGSYVTVPLTIHWQTPFKKSMLVPYRTAKSKAHWYVEGGPYFGYGLNVAVYDTPADPKKIDLGLTGGLGLSFGFEETLNRLNVGARANYGFMNVYNDNSGNSLVNFTVGGYAQFDFALTKRRHIKYRW